MEKDEYSVEIVKVIKDFLTDDGWNYSFDEESGEFKFGLRLKSKIKKIDYLIHVSDRDYVVYAFSPVEADEDDRDMMRKMAEFVCRANDGLIMGNFELIMDEGKIIYKIYVDCDGGVTPSREVVRNSIYCCANMFERYAPGILDIIFSGTEAKDAVEKCEKESDE